MTISPHLIVNTVGLLVVVGLIGYVVQELYGNRGAIVFVCAAAAFILVCAYARARDDGRYAQSALKPWFDTLRSKKGLCCSDADGTALSDVDWISKDGHFKVRIDGAWIDVPDDAVITEPNRAGPTMVWPVRYPNEIMIRCFMPGALS